MALTQQCVPYQEIGLEPRAKKREKRESKLVWKRYIHFSARIFFLSRIVETTVYYLAIFSFKIDYLKLDPKTISHIYLERFFFLANTTSSRVNYFDGHHATFRVCYRNGKYRYLCLSSVSWSGVYVWKLPDWTRGGKKESVGKAFPRRLWTRLAFFNVASRRPPRRRVESTLLERTLSRKPLNRRRFPPFPGVAVVVDRKKGRRQLERGQRNSNGILRRVWQTTGREATRCVSLPRTSHVETETREGCSAARSLSPSGSPASILLKRRRPR